MDDGGALENVGCLIDFFLKFFVVIADICFFDNGDGLSSESALVDKGAAFEDDSFEGYLDLIFKEDDVSWDDL